jgi:hypothetical protein
MGVFQSKEPESVNSSSTTPAAPAALSTKADNVSKLFNLEESDDLLDSLNISELRGNINSINKIPLPILGGNNVEAEEEDTNNLQGYNFMLGGGNNDIRFKSDRQRYLRYNIFKIISKLEEAERVSQKGGAAYSDTNTPENGDEKYVSITSDKEAIKNIQELILKELDTLKQTKSIPQNGGGDCNCDKTQSGGKKSKKSKKLSRFSTSEPTKQDTSSSSSSSSDDNGSSSSSSEEGISANKSSLHNTDSGSDSQSQSQSNGSDTLSSQNGGLSIFPFNSSEVRSSVSEKNMKMIRRKL